jgi:hypothetical protein
MARSISWQRQLSTIHRRVTESARTPYTRGDLESLFKLGTEAAKKLLQLMPRIQQGNAAVVERQELLAFLNGCIDAEDLRAHLDEIRRHPPKPSRRKVKLFVPHNSERRLTNLAANHIWLNQGTLEMSWTTFDDFLSKMSILVNASEDPGFEARFCQLPKPSSQELEARRERDMISAHNRYLGKVAATHEALRRNELEIAALLRAEADETLLRYRELAEGYQVDELINRAQAMLASLFLPSEVSAAAAAPASTAPPAAATPPPPALADRSASLPGLYAQATCSE